MESIAIAKSLGIRMDLVQTKAYRNYKISLYIAQW